MQPGDLLQERVVERDPATGREVWRLTTAGEINMNAGYHLGVGFSADARFLVLRRVAGGRTALLRADLTTGDLVVLTVAPIGEFMMVPARGAVLAVVDQSLRLYDLATGAEQVVAGPLPPDRRIAAPFATPDGRAVGYVINPRLPRPVAKAHPYDTAEFDAYVREFGGMPSSLRRVDAATGAEREVWRDEIAGCDHVQPSPVDPDLWLIHRNQPPLFSWMGDRGLTPRATLLDVRTGATRPVSNLNDNHFHMHSNWTPDGCHVVYHGRDRATGHPLGRDGGGHFIGAATIEGEVGWERVYPKFYYGHVGAHTRRPAIIVDSLVTPDLLVEIDFLAAPARDAQPPVTILGRHGSVVRYGRQDTHPHPEMSPDGRCIAYNRHDGERTDVCVLWL